jgi:hypothetical protein
MGTSGFEAKEALCITSPRLRGEGRARVITTVGRPRESDAFARTTRSLSYFFAGAILESAGFAASGLASVFAAASGWSIRSTLAASRSFAT